MDGLNWVTYHNCMIWTFSSQQWGDHLTKTAITATYLIAGNINGQSPVARWNVEEAVAKQLIASSVPNHIFNRIKSQITTCNVWNTLQSIYQTRLKMIMVDLGKKLQGIKCADNEDVHTHFTKLNDLCEQLSAMGKILDDDKYASILLVSLPTS